MIQLTLEYVLKTSFQKKRPHANFQVRSHYCRVERSEHSSLILSASKAMSTKLKASSNCLLLTGVILHKVSATGYSTY